MLIASTCETNWWASLADILGCWYSPVAIESMTGFVSQVEFANGQVWVPNRQELQHTGLLKVVAPSPEEQRLADMYRTKGLNVVMEELKKY